MAALPANPRSFPLPVNLFFLANGPTVCIQPSSIPADKPVAMRFHPHRNPNEENNVTLISRQSIGSISGTGLS
jgi:hypothetical protein